MNLGKRIAGIDIQPSFKLWWNKYHIKVVTKGNWLIHDAMIMNDIYAFQNLRWHVNNASQKISICTSRLVI